MCKLMGKAFSGVNTLRDATNKRWKRLRQQLLDLIPETVLPAKVTGRVKRSLLPFIGKIFVSTLPEGIF